MRADAGNRTPNLVITSDALYQLSYVGRIWSSGIVSSPAAISNVASTFAGGRWAPGNDRRLGEVRPHRFRPEKRAAVGSASPPAIVPGSVARERNLVRLRNGPRGCPSVPARQDRHRRHRRTAVCRLPRGRDGTARTLTLLDGHRVVIGYVQPYRLSHPSHCAVDEREVTRRELLCIEGWGALIEASPDSVKEGR